jgi:hypothetical protein
MAFKLTGTITVECDGEHILIKAEDFGLEEADRRHIGDGDFQEEALYIYFDEDDRFKVLQQVAEFEGRLNMDSPRLQGEGRIVYDELDAEKLWPNDGLPE